MEWTSSHSQRNRMDVQEYAQTPSGHWYPRVEVRCATQSDGTSNRLLHTIHLGTDEPIPPNAFDVAPYLREQTP